MWLYLTLSAVLIVYFLVKRTFSFWERNGIPSVPGTFVVGSVCDVILMKKHLGLFAQEWYQKFSNLPYFGYYNGSTPVLMIRDIDIVKDVLIKDFNSFSTNEFQVHESLDPLLAGNPFFVSSDKWKINRSKFSQLFSSSKIKSVFPLMKTSCEKLEKYLNEHGSEDLYSRELATKFTTDNTVMCGFSFNAESFTNSNAEFLVMGRKLFNPTLEAIIKYIIGLVLPFLEKYLHTQVLSKEIDTFFRKFIKSNIKSRQSAPAEDFLQVLLQSAKTKEIPENELVGHSLSFFIDGFETSSAVVSYSMFELSRNQDIQKKLYDEVSNILAEYNGDLSFDALQKMEYLEAIFNETMRMYPAMLTLHKVCSAPYEFKPLPGKKSGYKMPKGGIVIIPVHAIHRDAEHYPEPEVFNPDRFLPAHRNSIPKCAFLGFGEGPRMCIGMRFGQIQAKAALATIVKSFRIKLSPATKPYKIDPTNFLNAPLDPILLNFEKR